MLALSVTSMSCLVYEWGREVESNKAQSGRLMSEIVGGVEAIRRQYCRDGLPNARSLALRSKHVGSRDLQFRVIIDDEDGDGDEMFGRKRRATCQTNRPK